MEDEGAILPHERLVVFLKQRAVAVACTPISRQS
jgi:hypothetical protein